MAKDKSDKMIKKIAQKAIDIGGIIFLGHEVKVYNEDELIKLADILEKNHLGPNSVCVLISLTTGNRLFGLNIGSDLKKNLDEKLMYQHLSKSMHDIFLEGLYAPADKINNTYFKLAQDYVKSHLQNLGIIENKQDNVI